MKYNNDAIIKPTVPINVRIKTLVICGFITFQSSLLPTNCDILTNAPINKPTDNRLNRIIADLPPATTLIADPIISSVDLRVVAVETVLDDDILMLIRIIYRPFIQHISNCVCWKS